MALSEKPADMVFIRIADVIEDVLEALEANCLLHLLEGAFTRPRWHREYAGMAG